MAKLPGLKKQLLLKQILPFITYSMLLHQKHTEQHFNNHLLNLAPFHEYLMEQSDSIHVSF